MPLGVTNFVGTISAAERGVAATATAREPSRSQADPGWYTIERSNVAITVFPALPQWAIPVAWV
jgi:hypothetical protein